LTGDEYAEKLARYERLMATPLPKAKSKPKPAVMPTVVSEKLAAAAKANPDSVSVRVSARDERGVVVVDPPRPGVVMPQPKAVVHEVDAAGRPSVVSRFNEGTREWDCVEYVDGYAPKPGAVSNYDPMSRLRGTGE
jgi:hypothetical protein